MFSRLLLLNSFALLLCASALAASRPNVLVILVDDMGWSDIGPYGGEIHTPALDSLAANGVRFRHFYNEARCSPTRIALMSGLHMQAGGVDPNASLPNLRTDNNATLAELLGANGYRTYMAGKWHLGPKASGRDPASRGFQHVFGQGQYADGAGNDYWATTFIYNLVSTTGEISPTNYPPNTFYKTDADGDYALKFLDHHYGKGDGKPFFLYLACNAPHFWLSSPVEYINKYTDAGDTNNPADADIYRYEDGWDLTRARRFARQMTNGVIEPHYKLSPKGYENTGKLDIPDWNTLSQERRNDLARRMAVYAAMVHKVDENISRILDRLRAQGELDNTIIIFFGDNGGNSEGGLYGKTADQNNAPPLTGADLAGMGTRGGAGLHLGGGWANVNNTPLRFFKHHTHEGGCRTPLIIHWPRGMRESVKGQWTNERGHAIDVMPTVLDIADINYPATFAGRTLRPLAGVSLRPVLTGAPVPERDLFIEHEQNRAMFRGKWKLVSKTFTQGGDDLPINKLELYNLDTDPMEMNTLGFYDTALVSNMISAWNAWVDSMPGLNANRKIAQVAVEQSSYPMPLGNEFFHDTFNRANSTNIDSAREGMSGTFAGMNLAPTDRIYFQGFGSNRTQIVNRRLRMAVTSAGMSENGLMMNFTGLEITRAGGFSVQATVTDFNSTTSQIEDRYVGFGVGLTRTEAAAGNDIGNPGSFRGRADLTNGLAAFFVELDLAGNVKVWSKGQLLESIPAGKTTGTLLAAFKLQSGFSMGDAVEVNVYFDGVLLDINSADAQSRSRTFTWKSANENYIGLSVRATGYGEIDDLIIRPLPLRDALSAHHAMESGLSGSSTDPDADPDGDLASNLNEWLWGTSPTVADAGQNRIQITRDPRTGQYSLWHGRVKDPDLAGVAYPVSYTDGLYPQEAVWQETTAEAARSVAFLTMPGHEWIERELPFSLTAGVPLLFFRVQASPSPAL